MKRILEPDEVWDRWAAAKEADPSCGVEEFARGFGEREGEVRALLETMLGVVRVAPPRPLVDLLSAAGAGEDGRPVFAGFRIDAGLGQGASGMVFAATDLRPGGTGSEGRRVALKVLNPLLAAAPERREQILREAEIAGRLEHPGIVGVIDSGLDKGYAWIASELVEGRPLDEAIEDELDAEARTRRATEIGLALADALDHAHGRGVVHRDLKPANVLLGADGRPRILDFGLARAEGTAFALSSTGEAVGTPLYMAPEQARGEGGFGPWTDVYALGLVLIELAAGRALAREANALRSLRRVARGRFRPSREVWERVDRRLRPVLERCIEPHPADRYPDARALAADLAAVRDGGKPPMGALSSTRRTLRRAARHPLRAAAAVLGPPALAFAGFWMWWTWPVEVIVDTFGNGKELYIDGELCGMTNTRVRLRPGSYVFEVELATAGPERPRYRTTVEVEPRTPAHVFLLLDPSNPVERLEEPPGDVGGGNFAWLQVSTQLETIDLFVGDRVYERVPGVVALPVEFGVHSVRIEADGFVPFEDDVRVDDPELRHLAVELDAVGSPWTTITLYGPDDWQVRSNLVVFEGLRTHIEASTTQTRSSTYTEKAYWAPAWSFETGVAIVEVDLPFSPSAIEIVRETEDLVGAGWDRIDFGPSWEEEDLVPLLARRPEWLPEELQAPGLGDEPDPGNLANLMDAMEGRTKLFVRFRVGGVPTGDSVSYACALRTNSRPWRTPEAHAVWMPAMTIRVRP